MRDEVSFSPPGSWNWAAAFLGPVQARLSGHRRGSFTENCLAVTNLVAEQPDLRAKDQRTTSRHAVEGRTTGFIIRGVATLAVCMVLAFAVACGLFVGILMWRPVIQIGSKVAQGPISGSRVMYEIHGDGSEWLTGTVIIDVRLTNPSYFPVQVVWGDPSANAQGLLYLSSWGETNIDEQPPLATMISMEETQNTVPARTIDQVFSFMGTLNVRAPTTLGLGEVEYPIWRAESEIRSVLWQCERGLLLLDLIIPVVRWYTMAGLAGLQFFRNYPLAVPCVVVEVL